MLHRQDLIINAACQLLFVAENDEAPFIHLHITRFSQGSMPPDPYSLSTCRGSQPLPGNSWHRPCRVSSGGGGGGGLPLNCSETGLFRNGFASLICFAETGEKREREKKRVGEQLRSRLGVSLHDCEKNKTTFSCNHPILIRL